ncbi:kinase D-interacting substrate of 220 kDa-like isoform X2 [Sinocyclocheilus grahami]|uniref:kinase D-interacting substrate of 220 kDa-like isoform X2 n=1 Tax=Sinocyclocheilus grahami TaxID=75366 RepID=UPI0007AD5D58|nr:PREDICTED: kinase D-interacting substrate of 220 kDa-like isoform X2 [Sinocyclocheilus grahami]
MRGFLKTSPPLKMWSLCWRLMVIFVVLRCFFRHTPLFSPLVMWRCSYLVLSTEIIAAPETWTLKQTWISLGATFISSRCTRCTREDAPWGSQLSHTAPTRCFGTVHSTFGQHSLACSPTGSFPPAGVLPAAQPHSSYFSGLTGPQHPFYNRPYFPHHVYHLPRHYPGNPHHAPSRPATKLHKDPSLGLDVIREDSSEGLPSPTSPSMSQIKSQPFRTKQGSDSVVSSGSQVLLSSLSIDGICEKLKQIQGLDSSMLEQYISTIKKANMNGRVLSQCNLDELKKEMNMNFGDWHLFRSMVLEQRHVENQLLHDESRACSEQGSSMLTQLEPHRPSEAP